MTINAKNPVRTANAAIRITKQAARYRIRHGSEKTGYGERCFFCSRFFGMTKEKVKILWQKLPFRASNNFSKNGQWVVKTAENLRKCLAFKVKSYYIGSLRNVVGLRLMQGVAKLRKVAEVLMTCFVYLKLPHIANSKGTIVAK